MTKLSAALQPHLLYHRWYLDDGTLIVDDHAAAMSAIAIITEFGLHLNIAKTEIKPLLSNFRALGCPFGDDAYCLAYAEKKLQPAFDLLTKMSILSDAHHAFTLLRHCVSFCRSVTLLRCIASPAIFSLLQRFDREVASQLQHILSLPLSQAEWSQVSLAIANGGCGLRESARHAEAALLASISLAAKLDGDCPTTHPFWPEAVAAFNAKVARNHRLQVLQQKELSHRVDLAVSDALLVNDSNVSLCAANGL